MWKGLGPTMKQNVRGEGMRKALLVLYKIKAKREVRIHCTQAAL